MRPLLPTAKRKRQLWAASPRERRYLDVAFLKPTLSYANDVEYRNALYIDAIHSGRISAEFAFARSIWLPLTTQTLRALKRAIADSDRDRTYGLCEHLRESARVMGARAYAVAASDIAAAFQRGDAQQATRIIDDGLQRLTEVIEWIERRSQSRRKAHRPSMSRTAHRVPFPVVVS